MLAALALTSLVHAQDDTPTGAVVIVPEEKAKDVNYARRPEGLGAGVGTLGLTIAWRSSDVWALQASLGYWTSVTASADWVYNLVVLGSEDPRDTKLRWALYTGAGARVVTWDRVGYWREDGFDNTGLGVHVPVGIAMLPNAVAIDAFAQFAPGVTVVPGVGFAYDAAVGARYFF